MFVALRGEQFDGHRYIDRAVAAGAAVVLVERLPAGLPPEVLAIEVADTLQALGRLAAYRRHLFAQRLQVAAITGSSGKTTVKELTAAIFSEALAGVRTGIDPLLKTGAISTISSACRCRCCPWRPATGWPSSRWA